MKELPAKIVPIINSRDYNSIVFLSIVSKTYNLFDVNVSY
jgi:hypothetical protein